MQKNRTTTKTMWYWQYISAISQPALCISALASKEPSLRPRKHPHHLEMTRQKTCMSQDWAQVSGHSGTASAWLADASLYKTTGTQQILSSFYCTVPGKMVTLSANEPFPDIRYILYLLSLVTYSTFRSSSPSWLTLQWYGEIFLFYILYHIPTYQPSVKIMCTSTLIDSLSNLIDTHPLMRFNMILMLRC